MTQIHVFQTFDTCAEVGQQDETLAVMNQPFIEDGWESPLHQNHSLLVRSYQVCILYLGVVKHLAWCFKKYQFHRLDRIVDPGTHGVAQQHHHHLLLGTSHGPG